MQQSTHTRSCVNCYQRKLKCDRQLPCSRCTMRNVQCMYPENKITRNRPKKSDLPSLHEKVARLEKEVIGIKDAQSNGVTVYSVDVDSLRPGESLYVMGDAGEKRLLNRIGRVKIEDEENDLITPQKQKASADSTDDENSPSVPFMLPMFAAMTGGPSSQPIFQPTVAEFEKFFALFCERVDPIVRLIHKPTVRQLINRIKHAGLSNRHMARATTFTHVSVFMPEKWSDPIPEAFGNITCSPVEHALLLAIAYSATCSMIDDDPRLIEWFGETLANLRKKITFAVEVSMSRLKLYATRDFTALQAFTLYITTKILDDNSPEVWHSLWCPVALAVSIAHAMNLHKDGFTIGLSPFETEMRRRLWWHLVIMQVRTSENYSCELFSPDGRGVQLPANISDDDMDPQRTEPFQETEGATEMTASLLRYEAIITVAEATQEDNEQREVADTSEAFANKISRFEERLNTKYLIYARAHPEDERSRLTIALGTIAILKMCWVWGFRLMMQKGQTPQLSPTLSNLSDELFITATRMLQQQIMLNTEPQLKDLYWILRNIKPWDGAAILLSQIKVRLQRDHPRTSYDNLPKIIKDAWEVSTAALDLTQKQPWVVDKKMVNGLERMVQQIADMMNLDMRSGKQAGPESFNGPYDEFGTLTDVAQLDMNLDGMDLDAFIDPGNVEAFTDPWPMFIPMNFNFMGSAF